MPDNNTSSLQGLLNKTPDILPEIARDIFRSTSSSNRIDALLAELDELPEPLAYKLFRDVWSACDDTFFRRRQVLEYLWSARDELGPLEFLSPDETEWIGSLPDRFRIYRGCDAPRVSGLSWTTDRSVAQSFAKGHRGLTNPEPVLMSGMIWKHQVLAAINDREEREILADFSDVMEKRMVSYEMMLV